MEIRTLIVPGKRKKKKPLKWTPEKKVQLPGTISYLVLPCFLCGQVFNANLLWITSNMKCIKANTATRMHWFPAITGTLPGGSHFPDCPEDKLYHEESHISTSYLIPHTPVRAAFIPLFLKIFKKLFSILLSIYGHFTWTCICVPHVCLVADDVEEGIGTPGPGVTDSCVALGECWGLNLDPLQEQLPNPL